MAFTVARSPVAPALLTRSCRRTPDMAPGECGQQRPLVRIAHPVRNGRVVERLLLAQDARFAFLLAPRAELSHESPHRAVERAGRSDPSQRYAVPTPRRSGGRERSRRISYPWPERAAET